MTEMERLARIEEQLKHIASMCYRIERKIENDYVTKLEFDPLKKIFWTVVTVMITTLTITLLSLVSINSMNKVDLKKTLQSVSGLHVNTKYGPAIANNYYAHNNKVSVDLLSDAYYPVKLNNYITIFIDKTSNPIFIDLDDVYDIKLNGRQS